MKKQRRRKHARRKKLRGGGFKLKKALALGLAGAATGALTYGAYKGYKSRVKMSDPFELNYKNILPTPLLPTVADYGDYGVDEPDRDWVVD